MWHKTSQETQVELPRTKYCHVTEFESQTLKLWQNQNFIHLAWNLWKHTHFQSHGIKLVKNQNFSHRTQNCHFRDVTQTSQETQVQALGRECVMRQIFSQKNQKAHKNKISFIGHMACHKTENFIDGAWNLSEITISVAKIKTANKTQFQWSGTELLRRHKFSHLPQNISWDRIAVTDIKMLTKTTFHSLGTEFVRKHNFTHAYQNWQEPELHSQFQSVGTATARKLNFIQLG
jgi:hypothetical protein